MGPEGQPGATPQDAGAPADDFWAEEDARRAMAEHIIEANQLGGYHPDNANVDVMSDDDGEEEGGEEGGEEADKDDDIADDDEEESDD